MFPGMPGGGGMGPDAGGGGQQGGMGWNHPAFEGGGFGQSYAGQPIHLGGGQYGYPFGQAAGAGGQGGGGIRYDDPNYQESTERWNAATEDYWAMQRGEPSRGFYGKPFTPDPNWKPMTEEDIYQKYKSGEYRVGVYGGGSGMYGGGGTPYVPPEMSPWMQQMWDEQYRKWK